LLSSPHLRVAEYNLIYIRRNIAFKLSIKDENEDEKKELK
jgi:hypothetical protein